MFTITDSKLLINWKNIWKDVEKISRSSELSVLVWIPGLVKNRFLVCTKMVEDMGNYCRCKPKPATQCSSSYDLPEIFS